MAREAPEQPEVRQLIAALDAYVAGLYPAESNHLVDLAALAADDVRFFVARLAGSVVGCGALRIDAAGYGELKRIFVSPAARGRRIGSALLARLETEARDLGLAGVRLETGIHQHEALRLYRSAGYVEIAPFGAYTADPLSVFLERTLTDR